MVLESLSSKNLGFYAPRFEVAIEGQELAANISKTILNVQVQEEVDKGASFTLTVADEFDMTTQQFKWLDNPLFREGNKVTIKMGYGSNLMTMAMGNITGLEASFFSGETPTLTVTGRDLPNDYIKKGSPERTFVEMAYSDIVRTIASEAGFLAVVDDTSKYETTVRKDNNESYFRFLERLKTKVGYQFDVDGRTMYFVKPGDEKKELLTLELGKDLISLRPTMTTTRLVTEVEVRGHDPGNPRTPIIGRATAGSERSQEAGKKTGSQLAGERYGTVKKVISNVIVTSREQADAVARSELNKASDTLIEGDGECIGLPQLRKGVNIRLEKLGVRFSGKYYVTKTTHTINDSGYRVGFSVKRNAL